MLALVVTIGLAFVPGLSPIAQIAASLGFLGLLALYMRNEKTVRLFRARIPVFALIFLILGTLGAVASTVLWVLPDGPEDPRVPVTITSACLLLTAYLSGRYHDPIELRSLRLGAAIATGGLHVSGTGQSSGCGAHSRIARCPRCGTSISRRSRDTLDEVRFALLLTLAALATSAGATPRMRPYRATPRGSRSSRASPSSRQAPIAAASRSRARPRSTSATTAAPGSRRSPPAAASAHSRGHRICARSRYRRTTASSCGRSRAEVAPRLWW